MRYGRVLEGADEDLIRFAQEMEGQKRSRYTIKHYCLSVRLFQDWTRKELGRKARLRDASISDLKGYQVWLSTQKRYSKNSIYISVKSLQAFYRFLKLDTADELKPPKRSQSLPKYLTEAEASRLLQATSTSPRSFAMTALLLFSGLRVGELTRLTVPGIDFEERTVRIRRGKGDKDRLVVVTEKCMDIVRAWLAHRPRTASDYLFPGKGRERPISEATVQRMIQSAARRAEIGKRVTPHVLRHTLATTLLRRGGDIRFIQRILGHASIATTQVYTHLDDAELKRMYERAKPEF